MRSRSGILVAVCALSLALAGCDSDRVPTVTDGGKDSKVADAFKGDGATSDAGEPDDQGLPPDQALTEAGQPGDGPQKSDAPVTNEAGLPLDAGTPWDLSKPDAPVNCGALGQQIKLGQSCCPGLTPGPVATPPLCITIGQTFICVSCGDNKCDSQNGEDACSCPKDCNGSTATDCAKAGGYCTVQFTPCKAGYTLDGSLSCGAKALQCCMPNKCVGVQCPPPTCAVASSGTCNSSSSACDPATGQCKKTTQTLPQSCKMSGTACVQSTPSCSASTSCTASQTKLTQSCKQSGSSCVQTTPSCANNACSAKTVIVPSATCSPLTGSCTPGTAGCKVDCDCNQGLACVNGKCIAGTKPTYCCDKPGCPVGQTCTDKSGNTGTCPWPGGNSCVKQGGYCTPQFTSCAKGYVIDPQLSCGALALNCCVKGP
jgi:hypothetical protein